MNEKYDDLWEKFLKETKYLKLKAIRAWHRFDKEFGVSRVAKKVSLILALKLIALSYPSAQISLHAQNPQRKSHPQELLAMANTASTQPSYADFVEKHKEMIEQRQKDFALTLWGVMQENIKDVQEAEQKGKAARTRKLRQMFDKYKEYGLSVDPSYFCATGGLGSLVETIEDYDFNEYKLLMECLTSPNSCSGIISDLKKNFGDQKETNDIPKTLAEIYKKNPYAVCIVFPHSTTSRSGYHYTTTFSNVVAVDTILTPEDSVKGKTARFNRTAIADIDNYYVKGAKKGYVFDITEMIGNYQIFQMYEQYLSSKRFKDIINTKKANLTKPLEIRVPEISFPPIAQAAPEKETDTKQKHLSERSTAQKSQTIEHKTFSAIRRRQNNRLS